MPRNVPAALESATAAAAHLRTRLRDLATAVERGDEAVIAHYARALVQSHDAQTAMTAEPDGRSPNPPEEGGDGS